MHTDTRGNYDVDRYANRMVTYGGPSGGDDGDLRRRSVAGDWSRSRMPPSASMRPDAVATALLNRIDPARWPLTPGAAHWSSMSMTSIIRSLAEAGGSNVIGLGPGELAGLGLGLTRPERVRGDGYLATTDFPTALLQVVRATLAAGYQAAPRTFLPWTRQTTLPDFRPMNRVSVGLGPAFLQVPEHGEFKRGGLDAHVETLQLGTWGRIVAITRQAITNDELGVFSRLPVQFGYAAASLESDLVYNVLTGNPTMRDGNALFSTAHRNLASPAGIDLASMTAARQLMAAQTSSDGTPLRLQPQFLICGPLMETAALQFTSGAVVPTAPTAVIPQYFKALQVVVDPRITDTSWYLSASPSQIDTIEVARLVGSPEEPDVLAQVAWDIDAHEFKGRIDRAVGAIEWRGLAGCGKTRDLVDHTARSC
jgi:hypothetical protein